MSGRMVALISGLLLLMEASAPTVAASVQDLKQRIASLDQQIKHLNGSLTANENKKKLLNKELAVTEKNIGQQTNQLHSLQDQLNHLTTSIRAREQSIKLLVEQQSKQQQRLAQHLKSRYQMDGIEPLKWFINRSKPEELSRILTYYRYLIQSRQQIIKAVQETSDRLHVEQQTLKNQLNETQSLHQTLLSRHTMLEDNKLYQSNILLRLQKEIEGQQKKLDEYQSNRHSLSQLLQKLYRESQQRNTLPFSGMRHKLKSPIDGNHSIKTKMNQGVLFSAPEGKSVQAVFSGKVVFSDWLKGYGLLLILDHGQGYMTLYAHNLSLLRKKGETVEQGEAIATVGHSGGLRENGLYFEIRYRGKVVSAQEWLL